jgi:hypothetical protein
MLIARVLSEPGDPVGSGFGRSTRPAPVAGSIWRRSLAPAALAAAAIAVAVAVTVTLPREPAREGITLKGADTSFDLYVSHHGEPAERVAPLAPLHPEDVLKFEVLITSGHFAYVACIGQDDKVSRFWPQDRPESGPVPQGKKWVLPGSVVLDDYPGDEAIVLFASEAPIPDETAAERLHTAFKSAGGRLRDMALGPGSAVFVYRKTR